MHHLDTSIIPLCIPDSESIYKGMTNNTPFSSDPNPDLTQTIRSVIMNEAKYAGVERRAKSGQQQRATKGSSNTEYNHGLGEYRPAGEEDRYYAKQRAEAAAAKAKKTTTNESIEYTELLESVLLALCEELELDPNELVEAMRLTPKRSAVLDRVKADTKKTASQGSGMAQHNAVARRGRVDSLRAAAAGGDDKENRRAQQASDRETRPSPYRGKSYQQKYSHGS